MPTEAQFKNVKFSDSKSSRGDNFKDYLTPNTFEPFIDSVGGFGAYQDAIDEGRLVPLWQPIPRVDSIRGFQRNRNEILEANRQSPLPEFGTYTEDTIVEVYYWLGTNEYKIVYQLVPFVNVNIDELIDYNQLSILQRILVELVLRLSSLFPNTADGEAEETEDTEEKTKLYERIINAFQNYQIGNAFGVWVEISETITPIKDLISSTGPKRTGSLGQNQNNKFPLLPVALIGGGLLTGMIPLSILGGGLLLLNRGK